MFCRVGHDESAYFFFFGGIRLAEIQEAIADTITEIREQVDLLPDPSSLTNHALHEVAKLIRGFSSSMRFESISDVAQRIRILCEGFRTAISAKAPEFRFFSKEEDKLEEESNDFGKKIVYIDEVYRQMEE